MFVGTVFFGSIFGVFVENFQLWCGNHFEFFFVFVCGCWDVCATKCVCVFFSFHFEKQVVIMLNIESLFALDYICCFDL